MEIFIIGEINIIQISVLVLTHHFDILIKRVVQSQSNGMHSSPADTGWNHRVIFYLSSRIELMIAY